MSVARLLPQNDRRKGGRVHRVTFPLNAAYAIYYYFLFYFLFICLFAVPARALSSMIITWQKKKKQKKNK